MKLWEAFLYSLRQIRYAKLRSWLTIISIAIGIASIVLLTGVTQGIKEDIQKQLETFGHDTIMVVPFRIENPMLAAFMPTKGKLWEKDYKRIKNLPGVKIATKIIGNRATITYKNKRITATVAGVEGGKFEKIATDLEIEEGRFIKKGEKNVVVLGNRIGREVLGAKVGQTLLIGRKKFRIIGILKKTGNSLSNLDDYAFISFEDGKEIFSSLLAKGEITLIRMRVAEGYDVEEMGEKIKETLRHLHHVKEGEEDFVVITPKFISDRVNTIAGILNLLFLVIAGVGLLIGGIGIANTMFMAVLERTREIGTLKAIGMRKGDIILLFLLEAGILGMAGGGVGVIVALIVAKIISAFINVHILPEIVIIAMVFSFAIGNLAGYIPARNAASIPAVEALRYE